MNYFKLYEVHSPEKNLRYLTSKLTKKKRTPELVCIKIIDFSTLRKSPIKGSQNRFLCTFQMVKDNWPIMKK